MCYMDDLAGRGEHLFAEGGHRSHVGQAEVSGTLQNREDKGVSGVGLEAQSRAKEKGCSPAIERPCGGWAWWRWSASMTEETGGGVEGEGDRIQGRGRAESGSDPRPAVAAERRRRPVWRRPARAAGVEEASGGVQGGGGGGGTGDHCGGGRWHAGGCQWQTTLAAGVEEANVGDRCGGGWRHAGRRWSRRRPAACRWAPEPVVGDGVQAHSGRRRAPKPVVGGSVQRWRVRGPI
jgi:hypothetical protein